MIYYNEFEPFAVEWLKNLSKAGHINAGRVDSRSIREVSHGDVAGATQAHFFAGIGVWSYALRLAGWPDDRPVWTGSCPCQPFSVAGRGKGTDDARHLWPEWFRLIRECRPPVVFGEQVASPDGLAWLDAVRADLEGAGYAFGAADLCAAGVGAPHIRQRLYFVGIRLADAADERLNRWRAGEARDGRDAARLESERLRDARGLADADATGRVELGRGGLREDGHASHGHDTDGRGAVGGLADTGEGRRRRGADLTGRERDGADTRRPEGVGVSESRRIDGGLGHADSKHAGRDAGASHRAEARARLRGGGDESRAPGAVGQWLGSPNHEGLEGQPRHVDALDEPGRLGTSPHGPAPTSGFWSNPDWVACRDGKQRPVEPGTFPLAHGAPQRVGRLRAYGNAIVSEVAATFIKAVMETL